MFGKIYYKNSLFKIFEPYLIVTLSSDDIINILNIKNIYGLNLINIMIEDLIFLDNFPELQYLELIRCERLNDISFIKECTNLQVLNINECKTLKNISFLKEFSRNLVINIYKYQCIIDTWNLNFDSKYKKLVINLYDCKYLRHLNNFK
jgi:hypothetical protein